MRVVLVILTGLVMILGIILLIRHTMEFRDRPGLFIFGVLGVVAVLVFFIWLIATGGGGPNPSPLQGGTPAP